ncbi:MAG: hypothetical protein ACI4AM_04670, partial [Muribaculaceae bacterium]
MKLNSTSLSATILAGAALLAMPMHAADEQYASWPTYNGSDLEMVVDSQSTRFALWSPEADAVRLFVYDTDRNTHATDTIDMARADHGLWRAS